MRASVFIAASMDGFIARADGGIDWLDSAPDFSAGVEEHGYEAFIATVDALVMGRHTYEKVLTFGAWPFGERPVFVLTTRAAELAPPPAPTVEFMAGSPGEVVARLATRGFGHLYVDGGVTIQRFLEAGLIQRLIVTRIPVLLGSGIPLFGPLSRDVGLRHVETRSYRSGLVQSVYDVVSSS